MAETLTFFPKESRYERMRRFRPIDFAIAARLSTACLAL
jgi:hypothetical protein